MRPFDLRVLCVSLACLMPPAWSMGSRMNKFQRRNFKTLESIYNLTIYPNQLPVLEGGAAGVPAGLFNQNATGRVDPVGNFTGFEDSIEYFFALAPVPQASANSQAISSIKL